MFDTWNQKLLELGIPRWNVGTHVVEPLMTVMFLVVLLFFGLQGLLLLGFLYFVVKMSQRNTNTGPRRPRGPARPVGAGSGRRLGR
uniref:Uncharacterized protein C10orf35 homolog n=1 Tax=Phallusia mammillata TaxID=59560 RepID=A0A6F9DD09_9ASCI|nr:uncharacterized protein C10orf35 homolog [Phallusia mammillata]